MPSQNVERHFQIAQKTNKPKRFQTATKNMKRFANCTYQSVIASSNGILNLEMPLFVVV